MTKLPTILLVEDDTVDVMTIKRAFEKNGLTNPTYVVGDGEEALDYLRHKGKFAETGSSPRPGVILMDLSMPRMSGLELLLTLKSDPELREIPVVVLTASDEHQDVKTAFARGAAGYIAKPVTFEKFAQSLSTVQMYWTLSKLPGEFS
jgi:CheY-like chemotaxis protein